MDKEAVGMERVAIVTEEMMVAGAQSLIYGQENRPGSSWAEEAKLCYEAMAALAQQPAAQAAGLTDAEIMRLWSDFTVSDNTREIVLRFVRAILAQAAPSADGTAFSDGIEAAAAWVDNRREQFDDEFGARDPDTGAFEFRSASQEEYSSELAEIAEGIRALAASRNGAPE